MRLVNGKILAISDLHLCSDGSKPMEIFGAKWINHEEQIRSNFAKVNPNDVVLIPGDISWATYLEQSYDDLAFIDSLPGLKIIGKGNHDYWWATMAKMEKFLEEKGLFNIRFVYNNAYRFNEVTICGTRSWLSSKDDSFSSEDTKIQNREKTRLKLSLNHAKSLGGSKLICMLHFPPDVEEKDSFFDIMVENNVDICIYGHLHGNDSFKKAPQGEYKGIELRLVSSDYLNFVAKEICSY